MSNPHPDQRGLKAPWRKGADPGTRISNKAARAIRLARGYCANAVMYLHRVVNDENEETAIRVRAAEAILQHGLPKGDVSKYLGEETIGSIRVQLVMPGEIEEKAVIDGEPLRLDTKTVGSGD